MSGSDRALVAQAQSGERAALDELLRDHYDRIYAICRRITGNNADASDATQEALMSIVQGLSKFDNRAAFSTWSYRVATNACLDELRRRKRLPTPALVDEHHGWVDQNINDRAPAFDEQLVLRDEIQAALEQVPEEFRAPVILRDCAGLNYAEIAETLGIPPGTVRSRIARGRTKLAEIMRTGNQPPADKRQNNQS